MMTAEPRQASEHALQLLALLQHQRRLAYPWQRPRMDPSVIEKVSRRMVVGWVPGMAPKERHRIAREMTAETMRIHDEPMSPHGDPLQYAIITHLANAIEAAADRLGMTLPSRPVLGTLPVGQVNAVTVIVPQTKEHLVLIESQLFMFAMLLSKAVARALPVVDHEDGGWSFAIDPEGAEQRMDSDPSIVGRFADVALAYALTGVPGVVDQYFSELKYQPLAGTLCTAMEMFALGHEYGHVHMGHLGTPGQPVFMSDTSAEELDYSWQQEHEADILGAVLAMVAMGTVQNVHPSISYCGSDLYFSAMEMMDRAVSLLRFGDEERQTVGSHPPASARRRVLRDSVTKNYPAEVARSMIEPSEGIERVLEILWSRTRPVIRDARSHGMDAAQIWR